MKYYLFNVRNTAKQKEQKPGFAKLFSRREGSTNETVFNFFCKKQLQ